MDITTENHGKPARLTTDTVDKDMGKNHHRTESLHKITLWLLVRQEAFDLGGADRKQTCTQP